MVTPNVGREFACARFGGPFESVEKDVGVTEGDEEKIDSEGNGLAVREGKRVAERVCNPPGVSREEALTKRRQNLASTMSKDKTEIPTSSPSSAMTSPTTSPSKLLSQDSIP